MGSSPKAPDPQKTAAMQTGSNIATATAQKWLAADNQETPWGTQTSTVAGYQNVKDPSTGKTYKVPQFNIKQTPVQEEMDAIRRDWGLNKIFDETALAQGQRARDVMSKPFEYTTGEHEAWAGDLYNKLSAETNEQTRAAAQQRLAGQGVQAGSQAYDDAMRSVIFGQEKARNDFMLGSQHEGFQQAQALRNQPLNEVAAMMGMGGVNQPSWVPSQGPQVPGTDIAGLYANQYNAQLGQQNAMYGAIGGALGGGLTALGGWASGGFKNPFA